MASNKDRYVVVIVDRVTASVSVVYDGPDADSAHELKDAHESGGKYRAAVLGL